MAHDETNPAFDDESGRAGSTPTNEDSIDNLGDPDADGDFQREVSEDSQGEEK